MTMFMGNSLGLCYFICVEEEIDPSQQLNFHTMKKVSVALEPYVSLFSSNIQALDHIAHCFHTSHFFLLRYFQIVLYFFKYFHNKNLPPFS
jgi:hypothetical protein